MSHEKKKLRYFPWNTGCLIGILTLIVVLWNNTPHNWVSNFIPEINPKQPRGPFFRCSEHNFLKKHGPPHQEFLLLQPRQSRLQFCISGTFARNLERFRSSRRLVGTSHHIYIYIFLVFYVKTASKRFQVKQEKTLQNDDKSHRKPRNQPKLNKNHLALPWTNFANLIQSKTAFWATAPYR